MTYSIKELLNNKRSQQFLLYDKYLNNQLVSVLKTLGFDKKYVRAENQYLYDEDGLRYLDLLSGYGVHTFGRNHPKIIAVLKEVLDLNLANLVQFDAPLLAACFAERLTQFLPKKLTKFFFCNSGTEAIEGAIKFARAATKRSKILACNSAFHGLTTGSLALNGTEIFKADFYPLLDVDSIPFNDIFSLENALKNMQYAAFFIEPIQGKTVIIPDDDYFPQVSALCKKYGTLLIIDEIQTGIGRTGKFLAHDHWPDTEADIVTMAKTLSGGIVPIGIIAMQPRIFAKTYRSMEHAVIHSCTFGRNDFAMAAGLATLQLIEDENLINIAAVVGEKLLCALQNQLQHFEMVKEVRGKGMMLCIEFCPPKSLGLKAGWAFLEAANKGLFSQIIIIPLFKDFRILTQVAGHHSYTIKLLPPVTLTDLDIQYIVSSFVEVVARAHHFPGAIWDLGKNLVQHTVKNAASYAKIYT